MAKYVIENSDQEILDLKHKCRLVRNRISEIGMTLPSIKSKTSGTTQMNEDVSSQDDFEDEIDTTKVKRIQEHAKPGNM